MLVYVDVLFSCGECGFNALAKTCGARGENLIIKLFWVTGRLLFERF